MKPRTVDYKIKINICCSNIYKIYQTLAKKIYTRKDDFYYTTTYYTFLLEFPTTVYMNTKYSFLSILL